MITIKMDGEEFGLRCDLNVIEEIEDKYGSIGALYRSIAKPEVIKWLVSAMINEERASRSVPERMTPEEVGRRMLSTDVVEAMTPVIEALNACCVPKNAESGERTTNG